MLKQGEGAGTAGEVERVLLGNFRFEPTPSQVHLLRVLSRFLMSAMPRCVLIIKGYAGTGKTTSVNAVVKTAAGMGMGAILMAPTGRAAKVLSMYSGMRAHTIHRLIYTQKRARDGRIFFALSHNPHKNTLFVVDEASMIGWDTYSGPMGGNLLDDMMEYVFNGAGCRLLIIGDGAQLPPVGSAMSPALDVQFIKEHYDITGALAELTDVTRQKHDSGILALATAIRQVMAGFKPEMLPLQSPTTPDVQHIDGLELQEYLEAAFAKNGPEGAVLITRSNKRANAFNREIRARVYFREETVNAGDLLMCVKNNYHWLGPQSGAGFIANGDVIEVLRIGRHEHRCGFDFVQATVRMVDYPDEPDVDLWLWLNALDADGPSMDSDAQARLYQEVTASYSHIEKAGERRAEIRKDPIYNALQVKYAYAITCHKAQGGQWPIVFVDQGYITLEMLDVEYLRWLYTAVSRATDKLYLLNFSPLLLKQGE